MSRMLIIPYIPPTANERENLARTNKYSSAKSKKEHTNYVSLQCINQKLKPFSGEKIVYMDITFHIKNFNRDWDNLLASFKYINDGLQKAGIIKNDNLNHLRPDKINFEKVKTKEEEKIEIILKEEDEKNR